MSQLMRLWHFSSSVNSFFKCACAAIQRCYMSDFWSDPSSVSILHVCEQRRLWRDCADVQPSLVSYVISTIISWAGSFCFLMYANVLRYIPLYFAPPPPIFHFKMEEKFKELKKLVIFACKSQNTLRSDDCWIEEIKYRVPFGCCGWR